MEAEGIHRNVFNTINAALNPGEDAEIIPYPEARGGEFAKVYGPDKSIMDTGWSVKNAYSGLHSLTTRWFSDLADSTPGITIEYWRKDENGVEALAATHQIAYDTYYSNVFGNGVGLKYFAENCEYRIKIKSHHTLAETDWVAVDYIKILPIDVWALHSNYVYGVDSSQGAIAPARSFPEIYTVVNAGGSYIGSLTVNLPDNDNSLWTIPVCTVLGANDYYPVISSISSDFRTFTINVVRRDGTNWSGSINVLCFLTYYPIITVL